MTSKVTDEFGPDVEVSSSGFEIFERGTGPELIPAWSPPAGLEPGEYGVSWVGDTRNFWVKADGDWTMVDPGSELYALLNT